MNEYILQITFTFHYLISLIFSITWPAVVLICFLLLIKEIKLLLKGIKEIRYSKFALILRDPNLSTEQKTQILVRLSSSLAFKCQKTVNEKNVTGDGTKYQVQFEQCDKNTKNNTFTAPNDGIYEVHWSFAITGVTNQKTLDVIINTVERQYVISQNDKNILHLQGTAFIELDVGDTIKLFIRAGNKTTEKTISLTNSKNNYFIGFKKG